MQTRILAQLIKSRKLHYGLIIFLTLFCFSLSVVKAHVPEDQGHPLQLYSGWTTTPPTIDGNLVTSHGEWDAAFVRVIPLTDGRTATLMLMNDANNLYVGLSYAHGNNGSPNRVTLYFDQGVGGGSHDDALTANNENMVSTNRDFAAPYDRYWNGSNWVNDASGIDFTARDQYYTSIFQWEFVIPLANGNWDDLNVNGGDGVRQGDEIGFLLEIFKNPGGNIYWADTNSNPNNASTGNGWGDIRLGRNPRIFATVGASVNVNGTPTVDGVINEDAWRGCYQRDIVLTNFKGKTINARFYGVHRAGSEDFYIGLRIFDPNYHSGDYLQIYFEQTNPGPTSTRNYLLENNRENALRIDSNGTLTDYFFRRLTGSPGQWPNDSTVGDPVDGSGASSYSSTGGYWDYEFRVPQDEGW